MPKQKKEDQMKEGILWKWKKGVNNATCVKVIAQTSDEDSKSHLDIL